MKHNIITFIMAATVMMVLFSACAEKLPGPEMGWPAQRAVDAFCGEYKLEKVEWDGGPLARHEGQEADLDLGSSVAAMFPNATTVAPVDGLDKSERFLLDCCIGCCYLEHPEWHETSIKTYVRGSWQVRKDGSIDIQGDIEPESTYGGARHYRADEQEIKIDGEGRIVFSVLTDFYDFSSGKIVSGHLVYYWRCISGKQKKS